VCPYRRGYTRQMMPRLDEEMDAAREAEARRREFTLARQWLKERLRQEREVRAS